ncbi:MAG TPA: hypothetical protein V6D27_10055, partial [Vampirovibrionales bacterium]
LLYLQTRPDDLTPPAPTAISIKGQGFSGGTSKLERFSPLIIGQKFEGKTQQVQGTTQSNHATPRIHWRRGDWRGTAAAGMVVDSAGAGEWMTVGMWD